LNLACQAAIAVFDPSRTKKTVRTLVPVDDYSDSEDSQEDEDYTEDEYAEDLKEVNIHLNVVLKARKLAVFINRNDILPTTNLNVQWPMLNEEEWLELKELCPFLAIFKELTLFFSKTTKCRMSDLCLDFEEILVDIKFNYLDKKENISKRLWYAANSAYTKLTKYYVKIASANYALATVLDPRYNLDVYESTQDPVALKETAQVAIELAHKDYCLK
jgi:hypothetical protein